MPLEYCRISLSATLVIFTVTVATTEQIPPQDENSSIYNFLLNGDDKM